MSLFQPGPHIEEDMKAAQWMAYFDLTKLNLVLADVPTGFES